MGRGSDFPPLCRNPPPKKGLLSPSTPHGLCQGSLHGVFGEFEVVPELSPPFIKAWGENFNTENLESMLWRRDVRPDFPSSKSVMVRTIPRCLPVQGLEDNVLDNRQNLVFRFFALMFHNFVICASPFSLVFDKFFALSPFFSAVSGFLLLLFAS